MESSISGRDLEDIWRWNATLPNTHEHCVHDLISETAARLPEKLAICAWDGDWTYRELDTISSTIGRKLVTLGVGPNKTVVHFAEKSRWTPVAILAVMKAGGASVLIDCGVATAQQPHSRLQSIIEQARPIIILASSNQAELARTVSNDESNLWVVGSPPLPEDTRHGRSLAELDEVIDDILPKVSPSDMLYINFTSGTTGTPKGAMIAHRNVASALHYQQELHGFDESSRIYDFASYAFDAAWSNVLYALVSGACLCIPSDDERQNDLARSIQRFGTTVVDLTPSVARMLPLETIRSLTTLIVAGEALRADDVASWSPLVSLKNLYGPCECTISATIAEISPLDVMPSQGSIIGRGHGTRTWIVDQNSSDSLVPIGCVGELLLEGPIVGLGYLNDHDKTRASFIENPPWLVKGNPENGCTGGGGRLYKTGDLVYYQEDGTLVFLGRKDTQVKISGQRVELEDVEYHVRCAWIDATGHTSVRIVAAVFTPAKSSKPIIAAFIDSGSDGAFDTGSGEEGSRLDHVKATVQQDLSTRIAAYMIPAVYVPMSGFPMTATGKVDRKRLCMTAAEKTMEQLVGLSQPRSETSPLNDVETLLRATWSSLLGVGQSIITLDDNFLQIGGDSMTAMRLVGAIRSKGYSLTVASVFKHPTLADMATQLQAIAPEDSARDSVGRGSPKNSNRGSEHRQDSSEAEKRHTIAALCNVASDDIEDYYPCTPLQEDMLAATAQRKDAYINHYEFQLSPNVDLARFRTAVVSWIFQTPILRTRIVDLPTQGLVQVVLRDERPLGSSSESKSHQKYRRSEQFQSMGLGAPLMRWELVTKPSVDNVSHGIFLCSLHHALYDGWSMSLLLNKLERLYGGRDVPSTPPFSRFIEHVISTGNKGGAKAFWSTRMSGCASTAPIFPVLPYVTYKVNVDSRFQRKFHGVQWPQSGITPSTLMKTAWGITEGLYAGSNDVLFGGLTTGRGADIEGLHEMIGPTIATVPVRLQIDRSETVQGLLRRVQTDEVDSIAFEQAGLKNIRKYNKDTAHACRFQTLLVTEPWTEATDGANEDLFLSPKDPNKMAAELSTSESPIGAFEDHALTVSCQLLCEGMELQFLFCKEIISEQHIVAMASTLDHVLRQLCAVEHNKLVGEIETLSSFDLDQIWDWNAAIPKATETCLHEWISNVAIVQEKHVQAVCAWDGTWSYREVELHSTQLAHHLMSLNPPVGPSSVVAVLMEKSRLTPLAMLAVMKTGATVATLDSRNPKARLRTLVEQVTPALILTTEGLYSDSVELSQGIECCSALTIDDPLLQSLQCIESFLTLPKVSPTDPLYIIFTSGSTGKPKAILVSHANVSSALKYQRAALSPREKSEKSQSRIYDFASYGFDVAWLNMLGALTSGACLCVPSEWERTNDLAGSIERYHTTFLDMTPSTARILPEETIRTLEVLNIGGEALMPEDAKRLVRLAGKVVNSYGPSECTSTSVVHILESDMPFHGQIGKGMGVNTWVVDENLSLVPIGCTGELLLEGPLVGLGYLNDSERTSTAFIRDPPWILRGASEHKGRFARLYRTGDLVRYSDDGVLIYLGRRDSQVKINGQRLELGEIENCLLQHSSVREASCLIPKDGPYAQRLIAVCAFVDFEKDSPCEGLAQASGTKQDIHILDVDFSELNAHVTRRLPAFMVPHLWIAVHRIPTTTSGKVDGMKMRDLLARVQARAVSSEASDKTRARKPQTPMEGHVQEAVAEVLAINIRDVRLDNSFVANGGDSITAMRLIPRCRKENISMSIRSVLTAPSLAALAKLSTYTVPTEQALVRDEEVDGTSYACSPIQSYFFAQVEQKGCQSEIRNFYNQTMALVVRDPQGTQNIREAVASVVQQHSMLRARFCCEAGRWVQFVPSLKDDEESHRFECSLQATEDDIEHLLARRQHSLDIQNGPVFSVDVCTLPDGRQWLLMVAHHLVIDLVSWRIIASDLETLLTGGSLPPRSLPFMRWNELQQAKAETSDFDPKHVLPWQLTDDDLAFWSFEEGTIPNATRDHETVEVMIDVETTSMLLGEANIALRTSPVDLMLAAIWLAFFRTFPDRHTLNIFSEAHGRESWRDDVDLTRTVGWFTTMSPLTVQKGSTANCRRLVAIVKDMRASLPSNGWKYFASRFFNDRGRHVFQRHNETMELEFNYHGRFQELEREDAILQPEGFDVADSSPDFPASSLFVLLAAIFEGQLRFSLSYNKHVSHQVGIQEWAQQLKPCLQQICLELLAIRPSATLCDFTSSELSYAGIETLEADILPAIRSANGDAEIQDILPCSPMVAGMLLSQLRDASLYKSTQTYRVTASGLSDVIDIARLANAWRSVVATQPSLRAVFVDSTDSTAVFHQIILTSVVADVVVEDQPDEPSAQSYLNGLQPLANHNHLQPPHRLVICKLSALPGVALCQFQMSHAITDGASAPITVQEWQRMYQGDTDDQRLSDNLIETSRGFARMLQAVKQQQLTEYWTKKLADTTPCHVPQLNNASATAVTAASHTIRTSISGDLFGHIKRTCRNRDITLTSLFQSAWARILHIYTGVPSVCFGYLRSGRDLAIAGLQKSIGAYTNLLVCKVDDSASDLELVRSVRNQMADDIGFQYGSLVEIQHKVGAGVLFNTAFNFQRVLEDEEQLDVRDAKEPDVAGIEFQPIGGEDSSEYDISLRITCDSRTAFIALDYRLTHLSSKQASRMLSLYTSIAQDLCAQ